MKARLRRAMVGLLVFSLLAGTAAAADLTGVWAGEITSSNGGKHELSFNLKQAGGKITGSVSGLPPRGDEQPIVESKIEGDQITLKVTVPTPDGKTNPFVIAGKVSGNQIEGTAGKLAFTVTRK
jgi:hypothetical protein